MLSKCQQTARGWHDPYPFPVYSPREAPSCVFQVKNENDAFSTHQVISLQVLTDWLAHSSCRPCAEITSPSERIT